MWARQPNQQRSNPHLWYVPGIIKKKRQLWYIMTSVAAVQYEIIQYVHKHTLIFFLSGVGWHLPGLPPWTPPPSITRWTFPAFLCFLYFFCTAVFSFSLYVHVSSVPSCTRAAVIVATPQPTAIQQQHHNNSSRYIQSSASVSTRVRQRKHARMWKSKCCCREPSMYVQVYFMFLFFLFVAPSSFFITRKANRHLQLNWCLLFRLCLYVKPAANN